MRIREGRLDFTATDFSNFFPDRAEPPAGGAERPFEVEVGRRAAHGSSFAVLVNLR